MVLFLFFIKILHTVQNFYEEDGIFRPAGGETPFRVRNRVTPVIDTTYAVDMQTGRFMRWKPDSPAAVWYFFYLFHKNSQREFFVKKHRVFYPAGGDIPFRFRNRVTPVIEKTLFQLTVRLFLDAVHEIAPPAGQTWSLLRRITPHDGSCCRNV
jgi:hypothetical protein